MMTQFQIVTMSAEGRLESQIFETDDPAAAFEIRGFTLAEGHHYESPKLRPELRGQPRFAQLCGPMWGGEHNGKPMIRYEDERANDRLSR